jgi:hypothetical protein
MKTRQELKERKEEGWKHARRESKKEGEKE